MPNQKVNRVPIFIAALLSVGMGGYLFTWSYFRDSLGELFPTWSATQLSLPFSLHNITVVTMILLTAPLLKRFSNRKVLAFGATSLLIGFGVFPLLPEDNPKMALIMLCLAFSLIAACSAGIGAVASFDTYQPWFPERIGLTSGVWMLWGGGAPMLIGALCGVLTAAFGVLRAVQIIGIILAVFLYISLIYAKKPGPDIKLPEPKKKPNAVFFADLTTKQMLMTSAFYHIFIFNLCTRCAGFIISDLGGTLAIDFGAPTITGLLFAPANGISAVIGGILADKIKFGHVIFLYAVLLLTGGISLYFGGLTDSSFLILFGITCVGFGLGGSSVGSVTAVRIMFGATHYAQNVSLVVFSSGFATLAVLLSGKLLSLSGGSYTPVFILVIAFGAIAVIDGIIMLRTKSFAHIADVLKKHN